MVKLETKKFVKTWQTHSLCCCLSKINWAICELGHMYLRIGLSASWSIWEPTCNHKLGVSIAHLYVHSSKELPQVMLGLIAWDSVDAPDHLSL